MRKNRLSEREKPLKFEAEGLEFSKKFEVNRTIHSNIERSEQHAGKVRKVIYHISFVDEAM